MNAAQKDKEMGATQGDSGAKDGVRTSATVSSE